MWLLIFGSVLIALHKSPQWLLGAIAGWQMGSWGSELYNWIFKKYDENTTDEKN